MRSILYYVTGHGYGHAVRSNQVIVSLLNERPDLRVHVRTTAPDWLFSGPPAQPTYGRCALDSGILQRDSLHMDLDATLGAARALHDRMPQIIEAQTRYIREHDIEAIAGDIPPLCFEIAHRAEVPSVAIGNFTWSYIYRAYSAERPGFLPLIREMEDFYHKATLALTLPYPCGMDIFPRQAPIPWIARTSSLGKAQARAKFALPQSATIVLLSFGGLGLEGLPWDKLGELREFFFVATGAATTEAANVLILPEMQRDYEDLVRAVDAIVTKPGYGIVSDALAHRVAVLYTDRGEFPEYACLVRALNDLAQADYIPQAELLAGGLSPYLRKLLSKPCPARPLSLNGAALAAEKILTIA